MEVTHNIRRTRQEIPDTLTGRRAVSQLDRGPLHGKPEELQKEIKAAGYEFTGPALEKAIPEVSGLDWAADVDVASLYGFDDVTPEW